MSESDTLFAREQTAAPVFGVSSGILDPPHVRAIGPAVWLFLCLVDMQTGEDGKVKGGSVIKIEDIADRLGLSNRVTREHFDRLANAGYIIRRRVPYGHSVSIVNPKKPFKRPVESCQSRPAIIRQPQSKSGGNVPVQSGGNPPMQ